MTLEEARNNAPKINCFGLDVRTGQCSALQIPGLTLDMCMKCRFRKPVKDMTGRKKYPLRERKEPETQTYIRNGVLKCRRPAPERRPPDPPEEKPEDVEKAMKEAAARRRKEQAEKKEREQAEKLASKASRAMCKKCGYSLSASGGHGYMDRVCGYMLITGHRRPCLPGQCMDAGVFASREEVCRDSLGWAGTAHKTLLSGRQKAVEGTQPKAPPPPAGEREDVPGIAAEEFDPRKDPYILRILKENREEDQNEA
jgi:hypothetical protein